MSRSETGDFQRTHGGTDKVNRQAACERDASPELTSRPEPINSPIISLRRSECPGYVRYQKVSRYLSFSFYYYSVVRVSKYLPVLFSTVLITMRVCRSLFNRNFGFFSVLLSLFL
jgi:hypothetical protein